MKSVQHRSITIFNIVFQDLKCHRQEKQKNEDSEAKETETGRCDYKFRQLNTLRFIRGVSLSEKIVFEKLGQA